MADSHLEPCAISEEYDPQSKRLLGNFPQAFSHIGLLHAIYAISEARQ